MMSELDGVFFLSQITRLRKQSAKIRVQLKRLDIRQNTCWFGKINVNQAELGPIRA